MIQQPRERRLLFVSPSDKHIQFIKDKHNRIEMLVDDPIEFIPFLFRRDAVFWNLNSDTCFVGSLLNKFVHGNTQRV
ncbi:hypothetical protein C464_02670 [Halorubrum coriense DSM 10284]|uniref:Uncharacterized protein n=1 Tax=Halorubrum coriense DSM 10284 TaxID=1227466 RepID=M0ETP5_9EURY|nr:hypothetical protein C464_02670 [Halorubrum coriense DSM 10284]